MHANRFMGILGAVVSLTATALLASCGGSSSGAVQQTAAGTSGQAARPVAIRLALAPDPVWEWLEDSGMVARAQVTHNIRIEASNPFDPFSAFAGGHADVVVINALEVPQFAEQSGLEPVVFGQFTADRSILAVKRTSRAETLDDLVETTITVDSSLGRTLLWDLIADSVHDLEFRAGSPDFDVKVVEPASVVQLVMSGDVDACICLPDLSASYFAEGLLRPLYGGRSAAEVYAEEVIGDPASRPIADALVADKQWLAQNRDAAGALLELWQTGLEHWATAKGQLIVDYPHLFSVQTDEEIEWLSRRVNEHDWVVPSVYLTQENAAIQDGVFAWMHSAGLVPEDASTPLLDLSHSVDP